MSYVLDDKVCVGDLVQYSHDGSLTMRSVVAVLDDAVIVEGGYRLEMFRILAHIPMYREPETDAGNLEKGWD